VAWALVSAFPDCAWTWFLKAPSWLARVFEFDALKAAWSLAQKAFWSWGPATRTGR
jgi:hypothetical protein